MAIKYMKEIDSRELNNSVNKLSYIGYTKRYIDLATEAFNKVTSNIQGELAPDVQGIIDSLDEANRLIDNLMDRLTR